MSVCTDDCNIAGAECFPDDGSNQVQGLERLVLIRRRACLLKLNAAATPNKGRGDGAGRERVRLKVVTGALLSGVHKVAVP